MILTIQLICTGALMFFVGFKIGFGDGAKTAKKVILKQLLDKREEIESRRVQNHKGDDNGPGR